MIRRIIPLARIASGTSAAFAVHAAETPVLSAVATSVMAADPEDPNAGAAIIELHDDADVRLLETELRKDPAVQSVSRVPIRYLLARKAAKKAVKKPAPAAVILAAPPPASTMWNLIKIRWAKARMLPGFNDADDVKVAVLDSGVDQNHPDLVGTVTHYEYAHPTIATASSAQDIIGHGTHVSGTIAASINNGLGVNGICRCQLHVLKIFDDHQDGYSSANGYYVYYVDPAMYAKALSRCLTLGVRVVNLSIGGAGAPSAQESALFAALIAAGTTVVASMGNTGTAAVLYPAAIPDVIAVGATTINDTLASFSTQGAHIALSAPGVGIWSTLPTYPGNFGFYPSATFPFGADLSNPVKRETDYDSWQGTSMASPHVAAAAALLLAKNSSLTPAQVKAKLQSTAVKVPAMGGAAFTNAFGTGRLDLANLLS